MKKKYKGMVIRAGLMISVLFSGCRPGKIFAPTLTPSPTFTPTATETPVHTRTPVPTFAPTNTATVTPIPGIEAPITLNNGVDFMIQKAILVDEPPAVYIIRPGYIVLSIEIAISGNFKGENLLVDSHVTELQVIDENGEVRGVEHLLGVTFSPPFKPILIFGVRSGAQSFSLRFPNEHIIDLTPILKES